MSQRNHHRQLPGRFLARHTRGLLAVLMIAVTLAQVVQLAQSAPAAAAPGSPGTPSAPTPLYREDFENGTGTAASALTSYVGANGETYTADPVYLNTVECNGTIVQYAAATFPSGFCDSSSPPQQRTLNSARRFADVLGQVDAGVAGGPVATPTDASDAASQANHALINYTEVSFPAASRVLLQTGDLNLVAGATRFYSVSLDVAEQLCSYSGGSRNSHLDLSVSSGATTIPLTSSSLRVCTDPRSSYYDSPLLAGGFENQAGATDVVRAGRLYADGSALLTPAQLADLAVKITNTPQGGNGNDTAIDNLQVADVTPQLDLSFSPTVNAVGATSKLTYTITNRSDLASKLDWSFTNTLPSNLVVAGTPNLGGTCAQVGGAALVRTAAAGGSTISVSGGDLASGQTSCTITVDVTSAVGGTYVDGPGNISSVVGLDLPANASVTFGGAALSLVKSAGTPVDVNNDGLVDAGDTIAYTFTVTNSGILPVTGVTVTDPKAGAVTCASTSLAVGASTSCAANSLYVITAADVIAGSANNTATASGTGPTGPVTSPGSSTSSPTTAPVPALAMTKHADAPVDVNSDGLVDAGDTIAYSFTMTNTGNVPVGSLVVNDPKAGPVSCPGGALAPGAGATCTANSPYVITAADVAAGSVDNTAVGRGTDPTGGPVVAPPAGGSTSTPTTNPVSGLSIVKKAGVPVDVNNDGLVDAGDTIAYTFTVTNTGNIAVSGITVSDPKAGAVTCVSTSLAAGASTNCSANSLYVITAADVAAGSVSNTATASGTPSSGGSVVSSGGSTSTPTSTPAPGLSMVKKAGAPVDVNSDGLVDAGDTIAYTFTVTNTGNVPVSAVNVSDPKAGAVTCAPTTLAVGASANCAANSPYVITAADVAAGSVDNSAIGRGTDPNGGPVVTPPAGGSTSTPTTTPAPSLSMVKKAGAPVDVNSDGLVDAGDTIAYTFTVTNTGNVPVTGINVSDPKVGSVTCVSTSLAVGASTNCAANSLYVITAADAAAGSVNNTATASGTPSSGGSVVSPGGSTSTPTTTPAPGLSMVKKAGAPVDVNSDGLVDAGDTVAYTFTVTNTGNVPVTGINVSDPKAGAVTCASTTLAVGASTSCAANALYVITAADVAAGSVDNTAIGRGTDPNGGPVVTPPTGGSTSTPTSTPAPSLSMVKKAGAPVDVNSDGLVDAGDTIAYTFTVTNTGNVPVTGITVSDPKAGSVTCAPISLAVGASTSCAASSLYVITAADVAAGSVANTATATGTPSSGGSVVSPGGSTSTPTTTPSPGLSMVKKAGAPVDANSDGLVDAGDTIAYTFTVTNTGNVPVSAVNVSDPKAGAVTCAPTSLAVGASTNCAANSLYVITVADVAAGSVDNSAIGRGTDPDGGPVVTPPTGGSTSTPTTTPAPGLSMVKKAGTPVDVNSDGLVDAGDTIAYTFTVTNTGNVPVTGISVSDPKAGAVTCVSTSLAVGASTNCAANSLYVITAGDVAAGSVANTATASGRPSSGGSVVSPGGSTSTPTTTPAPSLSMVKKAGAPVDANNDGLVDAGDTIAYTFTVTNTGNVPVSAVNVSDPKAGAVTCAPTNLAVGASTNCAANSLYVITISEVAAGSVDNTAIGRGTDPNGGPVVTPPTGGSTSTPTTTPAPSLSMVKKAGTPVDVNSDGLVDAGDTIAYTFTVTNTGNVPVSAVNVSDPKAGAVTCAATSLAVGASTNCAANSLYVITAADVAAGSVANTATATGTPSSGGSVVSPGGSTSTPTTTPAPGLSMVKKAGAPVDVNNDGLVDAGDTIAYTFTVTNTGNVPVSGIVVSDAKAGAVTCASTTLAVGASTNCAANSLFVITVADEAAGSVDNTAIGRGTDPDGGPVVTPPTGGSTSTPTTTPASGLSMVKKAGAPVDVNNDGLVDAGDTIAYTFTVTNTGNVPVSSVNVSDPRAGAVTCASTTLAVGASTNCAANSLYVITIADEATGSVDNTAIGRGTDPNGGSVVSPGGSTSTPTTTPAPALSMVKKAGNPVDVNNDGLVDAGDTIAYTFTVTNTGNVPVSAVNVSDPKAGAVTCAPTNLAVGASTNCAANSLYVITIADVAAGSVDNTAIGRGTDPNGGPVVTPPTGGSTSTPTTTPAPGLSMVKKAGAPVDVNSDGLVDAGDTIAYTFTVTNTGNVLVNGVKVSDAKAGAVTCASTALAVGASTNCAADSLYVITLADEAAGSVDNTAIATASNPDGGTVLSPGASTSTPLTPALPALSMVKHAGSPVDANSDGLVDAGDTIAYTFTVTNTGNVPVTGINVSDPKAGAVTCASTTLAVGASTNCAADALYVITAADEAAGSVDNTAIGRGTDPNGGPVVTPPTGGSTSTPAGPALPGLSMVKHAGVPVDVNGNHKTDGGDTIAYSFTVTNVGNVVVTGLVIDDPLAGSVTCPSTTLAVGASTTCTADAPYVITVADEAAGSVDNTAIGRGTDPNGGPVVTPPAGSSTSTPVVDTSAVIEVSKSVVGSPVPNGDSTWTVSYRIVARNSGDAPGTYDLSDDLRFGAGITVVSAGVTNTAPGSVTVNSGWDGISDVDVATGVAIAPGVAHTYVVVVRAGVAPDLSPTATDCVLQPGETGTGFMNHADATTPAADRAAGVKFVRAAAGSEAEACAPIGSVTITKKLLEARYASSGGGVSVDYRITVRNVGSGSTSYDLTDQLAWAPSIHIDDAMVTKTPAGQTASSTWNGTTDTTVAEGVTIAPGDTHVWDVTIDGTMPANLSGAEADCSLSPSETGSGLLNTASANANSASAGVDTSACEVAVLHDQTVAPTGAGNGGGGGGSTITQLARTGTDIGGLVAIGTVLVLLGLGFVSYGRRRAGAR